MTRKFVALVLIIALLIPVIGVSAAPPAVWPVAASAFPSVEALALGASGDTFINGYAPNGTHGGERRLWVRSGGVEKALLAFDTSVIPPNNTVLKAWLTVYPIESAIDHAFTLRLYRLLRIWHEDAADWFDATATDMWGTPGADDTSTDRGPAPEATATIGAGDYSVEFDVTALVREWVSTPTSNMGVALSATATRNMERAFVSSNDPNANLRPRLTVLYTSSSVVVDSATFQNAGDYAGQVDTYVNGFLDQQNRNFAGRADIRLRSTSMEEGLIKFGLGTAVPAESFVANARLKMFGLNSTGRSLTLRAFQLLAGWVPSEATWNIAASGEPWSVPGASGVVDRDLSPLDTTPITPEREGWIALDVTQAVRSWVANPESNFGLLLDLIGDTSTEFLLASGLRAADPIHGNVHPILEVTYLAKSPDFVLNVVQTNDFHGALTPATYSWSHGDKVGGLQWIAGYYNILRALNPGGVVVLDGGDMMQGTLESNYFFGESTVAGFNALGLAGSVFGNHEFDWGIPALEERISQSNFPWVACNIRLRSTGGRPDWARPYAYLFVKGVKIGLIGVANPTMGSITNPVFTGHLKFTDPATEVNAVIDEVIAGGATVVIVDARLGGFSPDYAEVAALADALDPQKVDMIVSGHTQSSIATTLHGIPVVQSFSSGSAFGRVDLTIDPWSMRVKSFAIKEPQNVYNTWYGAPATYEGKVVVADASVAAIIQRYIDQVDALKQTVIGSTIAPLVRDYRHESSLGDIISDAWRTFDDSVDFALTNSGGIRADLAAGPITYGALFAVQPFGNTLVKVTVTGSQLRSTLEDGVTGQHGLVQVSGLRFTFNYDQPAHSRIVGDVVDARTNTPIEPDAIYTVIVNSLMAAGGDHYMSLPLCPQVDTFVVDIDFLSDYVRTHSPIEAPVMGRITTLGAPPAN